jgi:ABC-type phosphate transport system substrate-binding protein
MNQRYRSHLFFGIVLGVVFGCAAARAQDVVVIVNNGVKATSASKDDIASVFTGDKSSLGDGSKVTPVTLKGGAVHEAFLKEYIGKGDAAYRTAWRSLVFTGQGTMPKTVDSEAAMVDYVAATPGAIGYVGKGTEHDKVKTLAIK